MNRSDIQRRGKKSQMSRKSGRKTSESNWRDKESKGMERRGETDNQREIRLNGREERVRL